MHGKYVDRENRRRTAARFAGEKRERERDSRGKREKEIYIYGWKIVDLSKCASVRLAFSPLFSTLIGGGRAVKKRGMCESGRMFRYTFSMVLIVVVTTRRARSPRPMVQEVFLKREKNDTYICIIYIIPSLYCTRDCRSVRHRADSECSQAYV